MSDADTLKLRISDDFQRIPPKVGVPSLIRHVGFWCPLAQAPKGLSAFINTPYKEERLDDYIIKILLPKIASHDSNFTILHSTYNVLWVKWARLFNQCYSLDYLSGGSGRVEPRIQPLEAFCGKKHDDHDALTFEFFWRGLRTEIKITIHTEYITVSTVVDLSTIYQTNNEHLNDHESVKLQSVIRRQFGILSRSLNDESCQLKSDLEDCHSFLFDDFWNGKNDGDISFSEIFDAEALLAELSSRKQHRIDCKEDATAQIYVSKEIFVDFRRTIIGEPREGSSHPGIREPFWNTADSLGDYENSEFFPKKDSNEWRSIFTRLRPFLTAKNYDPRHNEFAVTGMLGGRVLHIGTLGQTDKPLSLEPKGHHAPVARALLYSAAFGLRELGKLNDEINLAGTCRNAAVMEMDKLQKAGVELRGIFRKILGLRSTLHKGNHQKDELSHLAENFAALEKADRILDKAFDVSFWYRIDRARHYINKFRLICEKLRIQQVDGFPTMGDLVEYRIGDAFSQAERLSRRYEFVKKEIPYLQNSRLIATIAELQAGAEVFFFFMLAPYYFGSTMEHFSASLVKSLMFLSGHSEEAEKEALSYLEPVQFVGWSVTILLCWFFAKRTADHHSENGRLTWYKDAKSNICKTTYFHVMRNVANLIKETILSPVTFIVTSLIILIILYKK